MSLEQKYKLRRTIGPGTYRLSRIVARNWAKGWHLYNTLMGKQQLKMLVLDLDGTALNDKKELIPENREALRELKEKNPDVLLCIATGRGFHQALRFAHEMAADIFITDNGGALYQRKDGDYELAQSYQMLEEEGEAVLAKIGEYVEANPEMIWHFSTDNIEHNFITGAGEATRQRAHDVFYPGEIFGAGVLQVDSFVAIKEKGLSEKLIKACVDFGQGEVGRRQFQEFEAYLRENKINFFQTSDSKLEIAPPHVNKGETLLGVIATEREKGNFIGRKDVLALGDSGNDRPMFEKGFQSLCPANAREDIKNLTGMVSLEETSNGPFVKVALQSFRVKTPPVYHRLLRKKTMALADIVRKAKMGSRESLKGGRQISREEKTL